MTTLRHLARRIQHLTGEERELQRQITAVLDTHAPQLLGRHGIGPDSAASPLITAGDNLDRVRSEASFAALCGVSPIEASSGKTRRWRLNPRRRPPRQRGPLPHRADPRPRRSAHP